MREECPFCSQPETEVLAENELAKAFFDKFPVNTGHVLIIPKRHFADLFEATDAEMLAFKELLFDVKSLYTSVLILMAIILGLMSVQPLDKLFSISIFILFHVTKEMLKTRVVELGG